MCCLFPGFARQRISCSKAHWLQQACSCYGTCWWISFVSSEHLHSLCYRDPEKLGKVTGLGFFLVFYTEIAHSVCYFVYRVLVFLMFWAPLCDLCSVNTGEFVTQFYTVHNRLPCLIWFCTFEKDCFAWAFNL